MLPLSKIPDQTTILAVPDQVKNTWAPQLDTESSESSSDSTDFAEFSDATGQELKDLLQAIKRLEQENLHLTELTKIGNSPEEIKQQIERVNRYREEVEQRTNEVNRRNERMIQQAEKMNQNTQNILEKLETIARAKAVETQAPEIAPADPALVAKVVAELQMRGCSNGEITVHWAFCEQFALWLDQQPRSNLVNRLRQLLTDIMLKKPDINQKFCKILKEEEKHLKNTQSAELKELLGLYIRIQASHIENTPLGQLYPVDQITTEEDQLAILIALSHQFQSATNTLLKLTQDLNRGLSSEVKESEEKLHALQKARINVRLTPLSAYNQQMLKQQDISLSFDKYIPQILDKFDTKLKNLTHLFRNQAQLKSITEYYLDLLVKVQKAIFKDSFQFDWTENIISDAQRKESIRLSRERNERQIHIAAIGLSETAKKELLDRNEIDVEEQLINFFAIIDLANCYKKNLRKPIVRRYDDLSNRDACFTDLSVEEETSNNSKEIPKSPALSSSSKESTSNKPHKKHKYSKRSAEKTTLSNATPAQITADDSISTLATRSCSTLSVDAESLDSNISNSFQKSQKNLTTKQNGQDKYKQSGKRSIKVVHPKAQVSDIVEEQPKQEVANNSSSTSCVQNFSCEMLTLARSIVDPILDITQTIKNPYKPEALQSLSQMKDHLFLLSQELELFSKAWDEGDSDLLFTAVWTYYIHIHGIAEQALNYLYILEHKQLPTYTFHDLKYIYDSLKSRKGVLQKGQEDFLENYTRSAVWARYLHESKVLPEVSMRPEVGVELDRLELLANAKNFSMINQKNRKHLVDTIFTTASTCLTTITTLLDSPADIGAYLQHLEDTRKKLRPIAPPITNFASEAVSPELEESLQQAIASKSFSRTEDCASLPLMNAQLHLHLLNIISRFQKSNNDPRYKFLTLFHRLHADRIFELVYTAYLKIAAPDKQYRNTHTLQEFHKILRALHAERSWTLPPPEEALAIEALSVESAHIYTALANRYNNNWSDIILSELEYSMRAAEISEEPTMEGDQIALPDGTAFDPEQHISQLKHLLLSLIPFVERISSFKSISKAMNDVSDAIATGAASSTDG